MARRRLTVVVVLTMAIAAGCRSDADPARAADAELAGASASVALPVTTASPSTTGTSTIATTTSPDTPSTTSSTSSSTSTSTSTSISTTTTTRPSTTTTSTTTTSTTVPPPTTSCERVAHIGDSTGVWLWEPQYVSGVPGHTMGARYREVGVDEVVADDNGGRAIVERIAGWQTNALEVATAIRRSGFDGCWVIMIGTNDAANVAAGIGVGIGERIDRLLYAIGDQPILWVDAVTTGVTGAYRNESMQRWNEELYRIAEERPNVTVLRWSERVRPEWFASDGIHYTPEGRAWRAAITALALAEAHPG